MIVIAAGIASVLFMMAVWGADGSLLPIRCRPWPVMDTTTAVRVSVSGPTIEAAEPSTPTVAASTTMPAAPATTAAEAEETVEAEPDKSDEAGDGGAAESESVSEQPGEPPPLCHELEFDPDDAAGFHSVDLSLYSPLRVSIRL